MKYIDQAEADTVKNVLLKGNIVSPINIRGSVYYATISSVGNTYAAPSFDWMENRDCLNESSSPLLINGVGTDLTFRIGSWGYETRLDETHIVIGSSTLHGYFCQLELSQCVVDEKNYYLVKQLTGLAGEGTMMRLNKNAASTAEKHARRVELVKRLGATVMELNNKEWLVVSVLPIEEAGKAIHRNRLFTRVLADLLRYALAVEEIIVQPPIPEEKTRDLLEDTVQSGSNVIYFPSPEDRMAIEKAAQSYAEEYFRKKGFTVEDCSMTGGLGYDLCIRKGKVAEYVEVKGTTMKDWCIEMKRSQYIAADKYGKKFHLFVVILKNLKNLKAQAHHDIIDPLNAPLRIEPSAYNVRQ